jgi:hypothetical protein
MSRRDEENLTVALIECTAYPRFTRNPSKCEFAWLYTPTLREIDLARRITGRGEVQELAFLMMRFASRSG